MQQRSPIDLELCASLLTYAARLAPSQAPEQLIIGPIWQYWHSGRDNAPEICRTCLHSVGRFAADRPITVLDDRSLHQNVHLPSRILARREQMSITHFSDILRSYLLAEHGGTWIDATVLLSGSIDHITRHLPFFAFTRPNDPLMLSSWFMHSVRGHPLMCALRDMLTDYWQENELLQHYNLLHFLFEWRSPCILGCDGIGRGRLFYYRANTGWRVRHKQRCAPVFRSAFSMRSAAKHQFTSCRGSSATRRWRKRRNYALG